MITFNNQIPLYALCKLYANYLTQMSATVLKEPWNLMNHIRMLCILPLHYPWLKLPLSFHQYLISSTEKNWSETWGQELVINLLTMIASNVLLPKTEFVISQSINFEAFIHIINEYDIQATRSAYLARDKLFQTFISIFLYISLHLR